MARRARNRPLCVCGCTRRPHIVAGLPGDATAHGSASWIMEHPSYGWCCGPKDCFSLDANEVRVDGDYYVADRLAIRWAVVGSFPSQDHHFWACYFMRGSAQEELKCFFAPPRAM